MVLITLFKSAPILTSCRSKIAWRWSVLLLATCLAGCSATQQTAGGLTLGDLIAESNIERVDGGITFVNTGWSPRGFYPYGYYHGGFGAYRGYGYPAYFGFASRYNSWYGWPGRYHYPYYALYYPYYGYRPYYGFNGYWGHDDWRRAGGWSASTPPYHPGEVVYDQSALTVPALGTYSRDADLVNSPRAPGLTAGGSQITWPSGPSGNSGQSSISSISPVASWWRNRGASPSSARQPVESTRIYEHSVRSRGNIKGISSGTGSPSIRLPRQNIQSSRVFRGTTSSSRASGSRAVSSSRSTRSAGSVSRVRSIQPER